MPSVTHISTERIIHLLEQFCLLLRDSIFSAEFCQCILVLINQTCNIYAQILKRSVYHISHRNVEVEYPLIVYGSQLVFTCDEQIIEIQINICDFQTADILIGYTAEIHIKKYVFKCIRYFCLRFHRKSFHCSDILFYDNVCLLLFSCFKQ